MILQCKNCLKRFTVKDSDIPSRGRTVQCGNCSTQWLQFPIQSAVTTDNLNIEKKSSKISPSIAADNLKVEDDSSEDLSKDEFMASDGKNYKFLGSQWAEMLPSGKFGRLARKNISKELNKLAGRKQVKKNKTVQKSNQSVNQYQEKQDNGMGIFSFLMVSVISVAGMILLLDTFKHQLISLFPNLDNYLVYIFETLNNIYIIIKDLFNNYK
ncbi:MAG: hypothetical protein CMI70_02210 [Candidatus Pelagibacter sp.]|jgi:predicted Zn finger-like uncharacterized protein|nr:hypothetical protein [Candidatus Pelagibacter sp.]MDP6440741.1 zinc-ribbon domain-containing protein [Pelagibacteraceae bacterium]|tara:strand:- start:8821 stop:9456 length:636 start_codon:yes stop_codon:yes gene_type:complete